MSSRSVWDVILPFLTDISMGEQNDSNAFYFVSHALKTTDASPNVFVISSNNSYSYKLN